MPITYKFWDVEGITNLTNSTNPLGDIYRRENTSLGGIVGLYMLVSVFFVFFITLIGRGHSPKTAFAATSFVTACLALILYPFGLVNPTIYWIFIILPAIGLFLLFILREG